MLWVAAPVAAHDVHVHVTPAGLSWLSEQVTAELPSDVALPDTTVRLYGCGDGDDATLLLHGARLALDVHRAALSQPAVGTLRVELSFDARAHGRVNGRNVALCRGWQYCDSRIDVRRATARVDVRPVVRDGSVWLDDLVVSLELAPGDIDIALSGSGCGLQPAVTAALDIVRAHAFDVVVDALTGIAQDRLGPMLQGLVDPFSRVELDAGLFSVDAMLTGVTLDDGLRIEGDVDLSAPAPGAACYGAIAEPTAHLGTPPAAGAGHHVGVATNLGLVDDALHQVWSSAVQCRPLDVEAPIVGLYLSAFPAGTDFRVQTRLGPPPTVSGVQAERATLELRVHGVDIDVSARSPDGTTNVVAMSVGAVAAASIGADPATGALTMELEQVRASELEIDDPVGAARLGFPPEALRALVDDVIVPAVFGRLTAVPVGLPVSIGFGRHHAIVRSVDTVPGYLSVGADLFAAPSDDHDAPQTTVVEAPTAVVRPGARVAYRGDDDAVPTELLRYRIVINGVAQTDRRSTSLSIGERGASGRYAIEIAAMDLAGNVDSTPAIVEVQTDGVPPRIEATTTPDGMLWISASDDVSAAGWLDARLQIHRSEDGRDAAVHDEPIAIDDSPSRVAMPELDPTATHRATVVVIDEAGNEAAWSVVIDATAPPAGSAIGCTVARDSSTTSPLTWPALALAAWLLARTRKR